MTGHMDMSLQTHSEHTQLSLQGIHLDGQTYSCVAHVRSGWAECHRAFYFDRHYAENFLEACVVMNRSFEGHGRLTSEFEDQYIQIECDRSGRLTVSGAFIEHSELPQEMRFAFETDQTVLPSLIQGFQALLHRS